MSLQRVLDKMLLCILLTKLAHLGQTYMASGLGSFCYPPKVKAKGITVQHYWSSIESTVLG